MENEKNNNQLQIELKEEVAQGTYANLAIITHSSAEENVAKYERNFGPVRMPEEMNGANGGPDGKTFIPPMSGFKGEA